MNRRRHRRGNTMILVAGILVLLAILATAYLSRTQAGRKDAIAVQRTETRDVNTQSIADDLAEQIAQHLFVWPVDPNDPIYTTVPVNTFLNTSASSSHPRLRPSPSAVRFGVDSPNFPYNFAPYSVVPWTNWPDQAFSGFGGATVPWPEGPGAPNGILSLPAVGGNIAINEGNPVGNPGFGDTRWLRDTEPLRWNTDPEFTTNYDITDDAFKYWRHMSYIAHPNNGYRLVKDISDVLDSDGDGIGGLVLELNLPVEQWVASIQPDPQAWYSARSFNPATGDADVSSLVSIDSTGNGQSDFIELWDNWFDGYGLYPGGGTVPTYLNPRYIPQNFINLRDLDADGFKLEDGERRADELVGPSPVWNLGSPRWNVSRVLADTDGDSYTDSFWFLAPTPVKDGIRQIVAVSIVDNSAMFNLNVATRFHPLNTKGETPADLALIGQGVDIPDNYTGVMENQWNVGFLDSPSNWEAPRGQADPFIDGFVSVGYTWDALPFSQGDASYKVKWNNNYWGDMLDELGLLTFGVDPDAVFGNGGGNVPTVFRPFESQLDRRYYWLNVGLTPFQPALTFTFYDEGLTEDIANPTPFSLTDELELRAFHGNNQPWIYSRIERAVQTSGGVGDSIFRATIGEEESSEYRSQLNNRDLVFDLRRKATVYNATRNDLLPDYLRYRTTWMAPSVLEAPSGATPDGVIDNLNGSGSNEDEIANFVAQARQKVDLREASPEQFVGIGKPVGTLFLHERLPYQLLLAWTDGDDTQANSTSLGFAGGDGGDPTAAWHSYVGDYTFSDSADTDELRRMAASFTANILAYRDQDLVFTGGVGVPAPAPPAPLYDDFRVNQSTGAVTQNGYYGTGNFFSRGQAGAIPVPDWGSATPSQTRFLGMEAQPFLVEAFVGHVYEMYEVPNQDPSGDIYSNANTRMVFSEDPDGSSLFEGSVVVVQIANPYPEPIVLFNSAGAYQNFLPHYEIDFFGQTISLWDIGETLYESVGANLPFYNGIDYSLSYVLPPATDGRPATMTLYAIYGDSSDQMQWRNFLDLDPGDHPLSASLNDNITDSILVDLRSPTFSALPAGNEIWETDDRAIYDDDPGNLEEDDAVKLIRVDDPNSSGFHSATRVVIDRMDHPVDDTGPGENFLEAVEQLGSYEPVPAVDPPGSGLPDLAAPDLDFPNRDWEPADQNKTHWVQFVRASRAWGHDYQSYPGAATAASSGPGLNGDNFTSPSESNPRFVFSNKIITRLPIANTQGTGPGNVFQLSSGQPNTAEEELVNRSIADYVDGGDSSYRARMVFVPEDTADPTRYARGGITFTPTDEPDDLDGPDAPGPGGAINSAKPWFTLDYNPAWNDGGDLEYQIARKPTFFNMDWQNDPADDVDAVDRWGFPNKGFFPDDLDFPMQMVHKNGDFQQIGELFNIWLWGHELEFSGPYEPLDPFAAQYVDTIRTFSEAMRDELEEVNPDLGEPFVNRLDAGEIVGVAPNGDRTNYLHAVPQMPAGLRVLDCFVLDGPGWNYDATPPLGGSPPAIRDYVFRNANGFSGLGTPGLININTASLEVLRTLPQMYRMIHADALGADPVVDPNRMPRVLLPEAMISYRERYDDNATSTGAFEFKPGPVLGPDYGVREPDWFGTSDRMRGERGFASLGELRMVDRLPAYENPTPSADYGQKDLPSAADQAHAHWGDAWRATFAAAGVSGAASAPFNLPNYRPEATGGHPFGDANYLNQRSGAALSTDVGTNYFPGFDFYFDDGVAGDAEEANLLLSGISNMITTRSDTFTVYFRVRSFRQNPDTGVWDATDPEYIVDDARYVMLVDRSEVNSPSDEPRILYMERLPY